MNLVIHSNSPARNKQRITYSLFDGDKQIGPFVEHRPIGDDLDAWGQRVKTAFEAEAAIKNVNLYAIMEATLDNNIQPGTYDAVRSSLFELGAQKVDLGEGKELSVRPVEEVAVEDFETALKLKIEAKLGLGKYNAIKGVLQAMGVTSVKVVRQAEVQV